jgi:Cu/Ag efflux protein CusF
MKTNKAPFNWERTMKNKFLIYSLLIFGLIGSACSSTKPESKSPTASASAQKFEVKGKVVSVDKAKHEVTIAHEEIKGYMEAMTMPFTLLDDYVYSELKPGSQILATLVVDQGRTWLEDAIVSNADQNRRYRGRTHRRGGDARFRAGKSGRQEDQLQTISREGADYDLHLHAMPAARLLPADDQELHDDQPRITEQARATRQDASAQRHRRS